MAKLDWHLHRKGCVTCARTQDFLTKHKLAAAVVADARKAPLKKKEALAFVRDADEIFAARGKKVVRIDLKKDKPTDAALEAVIIGPSGNLRAPTLKMGRTLVIGFNEDMYRKLLT